PTTSSPGPRQFPPPRPPLAPAVPYPADGPRPPPPIAPLDDRRPRRASPHALACSLCAIPADAVAAPCPPPDSAAPAGVPATRPRCWIPRSLPDPAVRSRRPHVRLEIWLLGLGLRNLRCLTAGRIGSAVFAEAKG
ncbi:unnamed protein product, partial [Urochloa humidicola]